MHDRTIQWKEGCEMDQPIIPSQGFSRSISYSVKIQVNYQYGCRPPSYLVRTCTRTRLAN